MQIPPIRRALIVAVLTALSAVLTVSTPARAADMVAVHRVDARIRVAQHRLERWQHALAHWQVHVAKLETRVQRMSYVPWLQALPPAPDVLTRRSAMRVSLLARVDDAHRQLQALLRDHRAQEAIQQAAAWSAYLMQLDAARAAALARPAHVAGSSISGPVTFEGWARAFLGAIDAPTCDENLLLVVAWETQESTAALYNPLATTHDMAGATVFNGAGVKNYVSVSQGVEAAKDTLLAGAASYGYQAVVDSLRACAHADATAMTVRDSAWCRDCGGGAYLVGLVPIVRASYADHAARVIATPA